MSQLAKHGKIYAHVRFTRIMIIIIDKVIIKLPELSNLFVSVGQ